ncbi:hypothetical protein IGI37_002117 [Enterococcus sp. AZ194]|uniref:serine aminopeptidase domain-containing protein n=1 Tax=Enterococcus sp. AZ194 TaxID=2774629 RepID=UPI003F20E1AF
MKKHFFKKFEFEFETYRLLWYGSTGGSDFTEVANVTEKIKDGNYESWHREWQKFAEKLETRASLFTEPQVVGKAYLRASRYYQAAEFFLDPHDSRKRTMYDKSVTLFYKGLEKIDVAYVTHSVSYQNALLRTVFFSKQTPESKGTVYVCGGFDALLEELYFTNAKYLTENGYDVIIYEGPGQSDVIRNYPLPFDKNWNQVASVVKEFYQTNYLLSEYTIGIGLSLGGLLLSRAASLDQKLYDRIVLYNYFPSMIESFKSSIPTFLHRYLTKGFPDVLEKLISYFISKQPYLNWQAEHAKWVIGASSLNELLVHLQELSEEIAYTRLVTDTLVLAAEKEHFYPSKLAKEFFHKIPAENKKLILFNKSEHSTDMHCEAGSGYAANDEIVEWLANRKNKD